MPIQTYAIQPIARRKAVFSLLITCTALVVPLFMLPVGSSAQVVQNEKPDLLNTVYVDLSNTSCAEDGSSAHPFNTIAEGVAAVANSGKILIHPGDYGEKLTVNQAMTWRTTGGVVTIGRGNVAPVFCYKLYLPLVTFGR